MTQAPVRQPATEEESEPEQPRRSRRWMLWTIKLAVTFGVLAWLFHDIGLASLKSHWYRVTLGGLGTALALQLIAYAIGLYRWWLLLRHANVRVPYLSVKPAYYLGLFFNQLLPTGVGGDAVRTYRLYKRGLEARGLVGSALMDRLIGTFSIVGLGIAGLILSGAFSLSGRDLLVLVGMEAAAVVGFAALFTPAIHDSLQRPLARLHHRHMIRGLSEVIELCHSYGRAPGLLLAAVALSVLMQSTEVMIYVTLGHELGLDLSPGVYFAVVPISFIAAALPISLGGLGVREGVLVSLLVAAGIDKQSAVALAMLFLIVLWTSVLPGLLLFLRGRH